MCVLNDSSEDITGTETSPHGEFGTGSARGSLLDSVQGVVEALRRRVVSSALSPFTHAPYPMANTLDYGGDPGLLGPESISWAIIADVAAFVGGIRGLLVQAAHPEVVAGVGDHSRYREDPLGRLSRTSAYVTATTYGAMPEVEAAVGRVRRVHRLVSGVSSRGVPYDASDPAFSAWVHNALTDSFLTTHLAYGGIKLSSEDADRFVAEQSRVGALTGADPMPSSRGELRIWIEEHPDIGHSPEMEEAVAFLSDPPLDPALRLGYKILRDAALVTIPDRILDVLGMEKPIGGMALGRRVVSALRWALGYSPSWRLALTRCEAPIPNGLFKQRIGV